MTNKQTQPFDVRVPVAFGGGLASTLLLLCLKQGTFPAWLVASLSPLPIMIATIGFGPATGLGAAGVSVLTLVVFIAAAGPHAHTLETLLTAGHDGLIYAVCAALPTWWLARLVGLSRADAALPWATRRTGNGRPWNYFPLGLIVVQAALIAFTIVAVGSVVAILGQANFQSAIDLAATKILPQIIQVFGPRELPNGIGLVEFARLIVRVMPPVAACAIFLQFLLNLWLAARVAQVSNKLARPWPDIAREMRVPRILGLVFAAAFALCFLKGPAGLIATIAATVLGVAFALQGLAVVHDLSRGNRFRIAFLFVLYLALALLLPWPLAVFTLVGLIEAGFSLRDRKAAAAASQT